MSGSVSLVNGHIDPIEKEMTPQEAIAIVEDVTWFDNGRHYGKIEPARDMVINALEKQMPKKPYKRKEHKQNDYYCTVCKRYLGDDMELKHACLQPEYCQHCGQALDWSDTE